MTDTELTARIEGLEQLLKDREASIALVRELQHSGKEASYEQAKDAHGRICLAINRFHVSESVPLIFALREQLAAKEEECSEAQTELGYVKDLLAVADEQTANKRANEAEDALRELASVVGCGGYSATTVNAKWFKEKINDGIDSILRVEVARREQAEKELRIERERSQFLEDDFDNLAEDRPIASAAAHPVETMIADLQRRLAELPHTKDGVTIRPGLKLTCPNGHANEIWSSSPIGGRIYCTTDSCWDSGCQGDSGSGTHYDLELCSAIPPVPPPPGET